MYQKIVFSDNTNIKLDTSRKDPKSVDSIVKY